jgi:hypothetical protein
MSSITKVILLTFLFLQNSCITEFIPRTNEDKKLLVVEGLITDEPDTNTIKLSESLPLGTRSVSNPVKGCIVTITDDLGNTFIFTEKTDGIYVSDPSEFQGIVGRFYTLHIKTNESDNSRNYESSPEELIPVPAIDSVYFEKISIKTTNGVNSQEGCQVYLNTHDPTSRSKFYRWKYDETWKFIIPYTVPNKTCWLSSISDIINIKKTTLFEEDRISRYPLLFISNLTDRLRVKYSILVKQYSLNEDEYLYWEKIQNITEQVGGLYDIIPSTVPSNVYCTNDPNEKVLGYFSVSASKSKRLFINTFFAGVQTPYTDDVCISDTIFGDDPIPSLNTFVWVIIDHPVPPPQYKVITRSKACYDCTLRGTNIKPDFWNDEK